MHTQILNGARTDDLSRAAALLKSGALVAFPTETVYGLGADASNDAAVARIFAAKGRPADHPLIVHIAKATDMAYWACEIPDLAWKLAERFWPGPLTLILHRQPGRANAASAGLPTIGLRVPGHPVALALLEQFGGGLAAPSANRFGRISPTAAAHVLAELEGRIEAVLDGGACTVGLESTILDLSGERPRILRPGAITAADIGVLVGELAPADAAAPRAPGTLEAHYAPGTPLRLMTPEQFESELAELSADETLIIMAQREYPGWLATSMRCRWITMPADPAAYGAVLYARLREADVIGCQRIVVVLPPREAQWEAVHDRLMRAAAGAGAHVGE